MTTYPLSPMQEGMLFHSLYGPHSGVYVQQMVGELREELDVSAFRLAWQRIVERHAVLRTSFCLEGEEKPLQTVHQFVQLPFEAQDWRELSGPEQEQGLQAYLEADRRRGFDLTQAPLVRVALFRWKDADYRFVWTSHHALLDGRSRRLLLEELFAVYEGALCGADIQLKAARPFKDYIDWLSSQDFNWSEGFWRQLLKGSTAPTPFVVDRAGGNLNRQEFGHDEQKMSLSETVTSALRICGEEVPHHPEYTVSGSLGPSIKPLQRRGGCRLRSDPGMSPFDDRGCRLTGGRFDQQPSGTSIRSP